MPLSLKSETTTSNQKRLLECLAELPPEMTVLVYQEIVQLEKRVERAEAEYKAFREHRFYREHDPEWKDTLRI